MAASIKLVYLIIVLSIAADFISLGGFLFNTGGDTTALQSPLIPGANAGIVGTAIKLSKSAIKAAKKLAKDRARKEGIARNKAKKEGGKGMRIPEFLSNTNQDI